MPETPNIKLRSTPPPPGAANEADGFAYAELDAVSNFSFLRGASHADELVFRATQLGYRAIAITDVNSLAGVVRAHDACRQVRDQGGVPPKLIIGARLTLEDAPDLLVWATDRAAYGRLCRLLTLGKRRAEKGECFLTLADFLEHSEGLLVAVDMGPGFRIHDSGANTKSEIRTRNQQLTTPLIHYSALSQHSEPRTQHSELAPQHGRCAHATDSTSLSTQPSALSTLKSALGDRLSLAVSLLYGTDDQSHLQRFIELSRQTGIPLLGTNHVHYHEPQRRALQDVVTCVRHGCTVQEAGFRLFPNGERYLKSPAQMHRLFAPCPEAIARGLDIAEQCSFSLDELKYEYPHEVVPPGKSAIQYLGELAWTGAAERYPQGIPEKVHGLIEHELKLIAQLKYEAYFLTVYDLVKFARSRGILCQGRGSAANSAVCYCIGVTSVDPARIDLLFERFVSAARNEPPDIDVDFEHERREEVLQYIYQKYGRDRAGMTAEVITYRGRSAVRDVGKALGLSLDLVDQMAKKLDWWHRGTIDENQLCDLGLDPQDRTVRQVVALTSQLLGFPRHLSQHVGGMVMTHGPLCELVPIENASMEDRTVIEWDKNDIDALGILKVDCLGLGMLTCISKAFAFLNQNPETRNPNQVRNPNDEAANPSFGLRTSSFIRDSGFELWISPPAKLALHTIPPEDPAVYDMISNADTIGVFQIESRAQMSMLPRLRPRCFYDLVIEVAIVRPGPIQGDMVHPYLRRRNGEEAVEYPSDALRQVLEKTLGVPLFQEQAMRIAMVGAGFSAEDADRLRRAMAAWRKSGALDGFHKKIVEGMLKNGYTREFAERCFEQIRGFGEYGFPESHAASFALLVYVSAWLKRYHPAAFCAALLNSQPMGFYAPAQIVRDAREHGVIVRPVDVNFSDWDCSLEGSEGNPNAEIRIPNQIRNSNDESDSAKSNEQRSTENRPLSTQRSALRFPSPAVRLGLRQIRGLAIAHAQQIEIIRRRYGRFDSIAQFRRRTALPRHVLRRLAEADAFASMGPSRREATWQVMALHDAPAPLFEEFENEAESARMLPTMPIGQEVMTDYRTAGLSLKRHPVSLVRAELSERKIVTAAEISQRPHGKRAAVAGLVLIRQRPGTASGVVFVTLEDETGVVNLIIRPNIYERFRLAARHATLLHAEGTVERQGQVVHVMVWRLHDLSDLLAGYFHKSRDFH